MSPITSIGDLVVGTGTNTSGRLAVGAANYVLGSNGTTVVWIAPGSTISVSATSTSGTYYPTFVAGTTGAQNVQVANGLSFNPNTNTLTTTTFSGAFSGSGAALTGIPNAALVNSSITVTGGTGLGVSGSPVSLGGTVTLSNTGVTSAVAGSNIAVSATTGAVTISVTGTVPSATAATSATNLAGGTTNQMPYQSGSGATSFVTNGAGVLQALTSGAVPAWTTTPILTGTNFTGVPNSALTGSGQITVTGGTGLSVSGSPVSLGGTLTLSNTGVTSATGTANQVNVSVSTGAVTFSLPQSIATTSNVTFANVTGNAFIPAGSTVPTNGVYSPSANDVGISTSSTLALNIDSSQRVTLPAQPAFVATRTSSNQTSGTTLIFNNVVQQQGGTNYNNSTGVFTAPVAGWYMFTAGISVFASTVNTIYNFYISGNGTLIAENTLSYTTTSGSTLSTTLSLMMYLPISGTVSLVSATSLSGSLYLLYTGSGSFFSGYLLG